MRESSIEARLRKQVRLLHGLCLKFVSPGSAGVPDRIVILPGGKVIFVELKTDKGRLSSIQKACQAEMRRVGADVRTLYGLGDVQAFVEEARHAL